MATYTGVADANGDFTVPFSSNYTSGQKITVTAEKDSVTKSIELYAPSDTVGSSFIQFDGLLNDFPNNIGNVKISGIIGAIGNYAFYSTNAGEVWAKATGLEISPGITSIGTQAFKGWISAKKLSLPETLQTLGNFAFDGWTYGELLDLPPILSIPNSAFAGWLNAKTLILNSGTKTVGPNSFSQWSSAISVTLPSTITSIAEGAFYGWGMLTNLIIPQSVLQIDSSAFYGLSSCTQITVLANTPPTIQSNTFSGLKSTCIFKVPAESVAAYQAAPNWSAFAARIQAI